jgi:hypothetical protein
MNRYFLIAFTFVLALSVNSSFAQKKPKPSKEEAAMEKEWAKKLKTVKPLEYKQLVEEKDGLTGEVAELKRKASEADQYKADAEQKDAEIAKLKKELEDYNSGMAPGVVQKSKTGSTGGTNTAKGPSKGIVFKVQIGSFKTKDLTKYFDNNPNFSGEVDSDGTKKYTIGVFTDYWEADTFKKALRDMGVKGAWVVPYKDGQRVNIKDVLEGTI